ncbi:MAG: M3 family metallopeptidase [Sandaracinaceae bacterium]|nr:M3 family metallopeptidase [Sandaracinaceae bacterium]
MTNPPAQNPLLDLGFELPFDAVRPEHAVPAIDALIADAQEALAVVRASTAAPTYENTLGAMEAATAKLELASTVLEHLESVATTDALRDAYNQTIPKTTAFWSALSMDNGLYERVTAFSQTAEAAALDATRARFLKKTLESFRRNGAALEGAKKARLEAIDTRLSEITTRFSQNVLDATNAFELYIPSEDGLAGLPESARVAAREAAVAQKKEGYRFTLHAPSLIPLLTYLDDRAVREQVWRAYNTRATSGAFDNGPLLQEIVALRGEKAALLGYANFADLVLESRMAQSGARATEFVDDLVTRTERAFAQENEELQAYRRELEGPDALPLEPWDVGYYAEKLRRARFDFDEEELRPYFPVQGVLDGLFAIVQRLFDVRIEPTTLPTWDPAVTTYRIVDPSGAHVASFYADLYPRENKRGGAWMNPLISAVDGGPQLGLFCANNTQPTADKPALLTHREVETLFHEFGHLLHHSLSRVSVRSLAGTNVAWDFVELPSQIMENWCWEREALDLFARHYQTNEPIPAALFDKMQAARTFRAGNAQMRQLGFSSVDLRLHTAYDPATDGSVLDYARALLARFSACPYPDDYAMIAGFTHLFASPVGYAAAYYSYKWAEVLDADAFSRFAAEGVTNPEVGRAFRESILSMGDSRDPGELYRAFMGRDPELDALLRRSGLAEAA